MPNHSPPTQLPFPFEYDDQKLHCPVCGQLVGILDGNTGDLYVVHNPQDTCYTTTKKEVEHGKA